jgi:ubiquinone/menaquinone biosynthesis C-methylase UbiE
VKRLHADNINTPAFFDEIWKRDEHKYDTVRQRAFADYAKQGDRVLDIGAGLFGFAQYLADDHCVKNCGEFRGEIYALDFSLYAKTLVSRWFPQISYVLGDVLHTPFKDEYFDVVGAGELIEHLEFPTLLAWEMARVCKRDGWMIISTVDTECENAKKLEYPEHVWEFTSRDLLDIFKSYGETTYSLVGDYHMIHCKRGIRA